MLEGAAQRYLKSLRGYYSPSDLVKIAVVAVIYIALAKFGLRLAFTTEQVTTVWPPTGMALAVLLILGYRFWPGILIGAFIANIFTDESWAVAAGIAIGNTLEALVGAYLLRRLIRFDFGFSRITDFLGLLVLSGVVSTTVSATIGTSSLALGNVIEGKDFGYTWLIWWVGDMMGAIVFAPLILVFFKNRYSSIRKRPFEALLLVALCVAVSLLVFRRQPGSIENLPYLVFPILIWATFRFTQSGSVLTVALIASIAIWGTIDRLGPFTRAGSTEKNLILMQTFILVSAATAMFMAIIVAQRQAVERALRTNLNELIVTNEKLSDLVAERVGKTSQKKPPKKRSVK